MPVIPILGRLKQDYHEFKANLNYTVNSKAAGITQKNTYIHTYTHTYTHTYIQDWRVSSAIRALVALTEELGSIPRTHMVADSHLYQSQQN